MHLCPLRQAVELVRQGAEVPRHVRLWPNARLVSTAVGEPGGILHRLRLAADAEEAEELDHGEGKALMNGSLLLLTFDDFATIRCGVCCRREAARQLGDRAVSRA